MAIAREAYGSKILPASGTTITLDSALSVAEDDVVLVMVWSGAGGIDTGPSGYTSIAEDELPFEGGASAGDQCGAAWYKVITGAGTENPTVTFDHTEEHYMAVWVISGLDTSAPVDAGIGSVNYIASDVFTNQVAPATGTLEKADSFVACVTEVWADDNTTSGFSWDEGLTGEVELWNSSFMTAAAAYKITTATTSLQPAATWSDFDGNTGTLMVVLKSGGVATSGTLNGGGSFAVTVRNLEAAAIQNGGGSITAATSKFEHQILRPTSTITAGNWDSGPTTGQPLHDYAGDDSDATYVEDTTA